MTGKGRETRRHVLRFDQFLAAENTWRLLESQDGIACKARVGGVIYYGDIFLRWRVLPSGVDLRQAVKRIFVAPADSERRLWITQPARLAPDLLPIELQLEGAVEHVVATMSDW
jgi:hypothetical protein